MFNSEKSQANTPIKTFAITSGSNTWPDHQGHAYFKELVARAVGWCDRMRRVGTATYRTGHVRSFDLYAVGAGWVLGITLSQLLVPVTAAMNLMSRWQDTAAIKHRANRLTPERKPAPCKMAGAENDSWDALRCFKGCSLGVRC